jgi:hypothetical protein
MSVNLDRLREAVEAAEDIIPSWVQPVVDAAGAVLDAPRVWSCSLGLDTPTAPPGWCDDGRHGGRCGWYELVPREGKP